MANFLSRCLPRITSGNDFGWFFVEKHSGLISTVRNLDYEVLGSNNQIVLSLDASDETAAPRSSNTSVRVTILDENDNRPTFSRRVYEVQLNATSPLEKVVRLTARDSDSGDNGTVIYSAEYVRTAAGRLNAAGLFNVDSSTGVVSVTDALIDLQEPQCDLVIAALDRGKPALRSTAMVRVYYENLVSSQPVFYPRKHYIPLLAGSYANLIIATITVGDNEKSYPSLRYSISPLSRGLNIDAITGEVTISGTFAAGDSMRFSVQASDMFSEEVIAEADVFVVLDAFNTAVQFSSAVYEYSVLEDARALQIVGRVDVKTTQDFSVLYEITAGDPTGIFTIDNSTGHIFILRNDSLDREKQVVHSLTVVSKQSSAHGSVASFSKCSVLVFVRDVNDHAPQFAGDAIKTWHSGIDAARSMASTTLYMTGRAMVGEVVYSATVADLDEGLNGEVTFTVLDALDMFSVDIFGRIIVKRPFHSKDCVNTITVIACDRGSPMLCSELDLTVHTVALFRNGFLGSELRGEVAEDAVVNTVVTNVAQTLTDAFQFPVAVTSNGDIQTVVTYDVIAGNIGEVFGVFPDGRMYVVKSDLDREIRSHYSVVVNTTLYKGNFSRSENVTVLVHVTDVNDNPPVFTSELYSFVVRENAPVGTQIGFVLADDVDRGVHASLVYSMHPHSSDALLPFTIDRFSGAVSTAAKFDLETLNRTWGSTVLDQNGFIEFWANVTDNAGTDHPNLVKFTTSVRVKVTVEDVNEFAPEFEKTKYYARISEGSTRGTNILQARAHDKDFTSNMRFHLQTGKKDLPFSIHAKTGQLIVSKSDTLDREKQELYTLQLLVTDGNSSSAKMGSASVQVFLTDANDKRPEFEPSSLSWRVSEVTSVNSEIGKIVAVDKDQDGLNSLVTYSMSSRSSSAAQSIFFIEEVSGRIILKDSLDMEKMDSYDLVVIASDAGTPQRSASATATIYIDDHNDNPPEFTGPQSLEIAEGRYEQPTMIGRLSATDNDLGSNARVTFEILRVEPASVDASVAVNQETGELFVTGVVDRETLLPSAAMRVTARASDNPKQSAHRLSSIATIEVTVTDRNDNVPTFTSPDTVFISADKTTRAGFELATIQAEDQDNGLNGSVRISFASPATVSSFALDPSSGALTLFKAFPKEASVVTRVEIVARDQGNFSCLYLLVETAATLCCALFVILLSQTQLRSNSHDFP